MLEISKLSGARVFKEGSNRSVGKIHYAIFHPSEPRVVGFAIRRMDIALMKKRQDLFLARDSMSFDGQFVWASTEADAWGNKACKRLEINLDNCVVWESMPAVTETGEQLGIVNDVGFDPTTGMVLSVTTSDGALSRFLIGDVEHSAGSFLGFSGTALVFRASASTDLSFGGAAAKAGEFVGKTSSSIKHKLAPDEEDGKGLLDKGAYGFGKAIARTRNMFVDFKTEYDQHRHSNE